MTVAIDALMHYVERVPDDPCGLNMLGVLCERQHRFKSAKKALTKALQSLKQQQMDEANLVDQVLHNLARVLYQLGEYEASIKCYQKMTEANFNSQVGLALSSCKADKFQQAYAAYGAALQLSQSNEQRSHVLAAMATIAYKFQVRTSGNAALKLDQNKCFHDRLLTLSLQMTSCLLLQGPDAAKTLLFQSCQQRPRPSLQGILALCVLGLQQSNPTLVQAAISEMDQHKTQADIIAMKALVMTLQGQADQAQRLISKAIHTSPGDAALWKCMSLHLLNYHKNRAAASSASACAQKSAGLCRDDSSSMMSLVGLCLLNGPEQTMKAEAKRAAIKAVHCYPQTLEAWAVLVAATDENPRILQSAKAMAAFSKNEPLIDWINNKA